MRQTDPNVPQPHDGDDPEDLTHASRAPEPPDDTGRQDGPSPDDGWVLV